MATYERLSPTDAQVNALLKADWTGPVVMVNLLQFRARAAYPRDYTGPNPDVTGAEAYQRYSEIAQACIGRTGGSVVWSGPGFATVVGPVNERWDHVVAVSYPNREAFLQLTQDPAYEEGVIHRTAALAETRVFACKG